MKIAISGLNRLQAVNPAEDGGPRDYLQPKPDYYDSGSAVSGPGRSRHRVRMVVGRDLPGRQEGHIPGNIQDQGDAAGVFQPMIFQDTGARFVRRASERNVRLADFEVYVFQ